MTFSDNADRLGYIAYCQSEIDSDTENVKMFESLRGSMPNKTKTNQLEATIKRFYKSIEKNEKNIKLAEEVELKPYAHLHSNYGYSHLKLDYGVAV